MTRSWIGNDSQPCLWMAAGLINYKLCDRDFDCDHCPLDAALTGDSRQARPGAPHTGHRPPADYFPSDRSYSAGHMWVQNIEGDDDAGRLGLDAFAASMLDRLIELRFPLDGCDRADTLAELQLESGSLSLSLPIVTSSMEPNPHLRDEPDLALTEPYGEGWLVSLANLDSTDIGHLMLAEQALERARHDLRLFRRRVALEMLADTADLGRCMADGGEPLTDLRQMLGAPRLLSLLQELIH